MISATNTAGTTTKRFRLKVKGVKPNIASKTFQAGIVGEEYSETIYVTGTDDITVTVRNLPDGLSYSDGEISGTPETAGTFRVKVTATNDYGSANKTIAMTFKAKPEITTSSVYDGTAGTRYSFRFSATGSDSIRWFLASGTLPDGMSINSRGVLKGKPTTSGTYTFTVGAYNSVGTATREFDLEISDAVNDSSMPDNLTFAQNDFTQLDTNETDDFTFSVLSASYDVVAELGEISVDVSGMYDFEVILSDEVQTGAKLIWLANSSKSSDDDFIAEFYDYDGEEIDSVPEDRLITVSAWLNKDAVYRPVIAVKKELAEN